MDLRTTGHSTILAGLTALGWVGVLTHREVIDAAGLCAQVAPTSLSRAWWALRFGLALDTPSDLAIGWAEMVLAMTPLLLFVLPRPTDLPGRRTRDRNLCSFAMGYGLVWMVAGVVFVPAALAFYGAWPTVNSALAAWAVVAVAWRVSPMHRWGAKAWLRTAVAVSASPLGGLAAVTIGVQHGVTCLLTCWPLMLLPMIVHGGHGIAMAAALAAAMALQLAERAGLRLPWVASLCSDTSLGRRVFLRAAPR